MPDLSTLSQYLISVPYLSTLSQDLISITVVGVELQASAKGSSKSGVEPVTRNKKSCGLVFYECFDDIEFDITVLRGVERK